MAFNYLSLTNDILNKMNEVPLNEANFAGAAGFYSDAKNAVNFAIDKINSVAWAWPFNHRTKELVLTPDVTRYPWEPDTKSINWHTFRIKGDDSLTIRTTKLWPMDYEDYLTGYSDMEYRPTQHHRVPEVVARTPELAFAIVPPPDKAYTLVYEYYALPTPLENFDDAPSVPQFFRHVINQGSFAQAFRFRGDAQQAAEYEAMFQRSIENMRTIFINRTDYVTSTQRGR